MKRILLFFAFSVIVVGCEAQATFHTLITDLGAAHSPQTLLINQQIGVMIWGQSNALGSTDGVAPTTSPIDYQAAIRGVSMYINGTDTTFNTLRYTTNSQGSLFNSDLSMGYALYDAIERPVFVGMEAVTGAPLYNASGTDNFSPDAIIADRLIDDLLEVNVALKNRCALYGKTPFIISIWIGGEADAQDDDTADSIRINYEATKAYILANGGQIDAEIVSILHPNYANGTAGQIAAVRSKLEAYVNQTATAYAMDMDAFPLRADSIHFTGAGQEAIGLATSGIILNTIFGLGIETYPGSYSADAKNALKNFRDDIPTGYKDAIADFVDGLQTDGNLDNVVTLQVRAMDDPTSAMVDIRGIKYGVGEGGTHDPGGGITYDGVNDFTDTGFQVAEDGGTIFTMNNCGWGFYVVDNLTASGTAGFIGGQNSLGSTNFRLGQGATSQIVYALNSNSSGTYTTETAFGDNALYLARRTASTGAGSTALIKGDTVVDSDNVTSNSVGNRKIYEGAKNNIGTADTFINAKIALFIAFDPTSFDYAAFKTRVDTLIAALAAL